MHKTTMSACQVWNEENRKTNSTLNIDPDPTEEATTKLEFRESGEKSNMCETKHMMMERKATKAFL
jgi:hypothetical protein